MSEAKKCLNIGCGRLKIRSVTEKFKNYFLSFFFAPKPCYSREELAESALANARGRPGHAPVLAKNYKDLAPVLPGRFRARQKWVGRKIAKFGHGTVLKTSFNEEKIFFISRGGQRVSNLGTPPTGRPA